jgi:methionyl-tRNA formyltransferase
MCQHVASILNEYPVHVRYAHSPGSPIGYLLSLTKSEDPINDCIDLKDANTVSLIVGQYDLVISLHCKQLFPNQLINAVKCINLHPGFNPANRGWYPQVFAILHHTILGATLHEISEELDNGPIIAREVVDLYEWDTSKTAYDRVVEKEIELFSKNIDSILKGEYKTVIDNSPGFLSLKKDYNKLLQLDLSKQGTFKEFIDYLRALTHPPYQNAYFTESNGEKIFVELILKKAE